MPPAKAPISTPEPAATPPEPVATSPEPAVAEPQALEPMASEPPQAPEPPSSFSLLEAARSRGIDPSGYESEEALAEAMFSALDTFQEHEPFVKIGQQFAPYADKLSDFQKWQEEQAAQATPAAKPEQPVSGFEWNAPEYDPRWEGMPIERDERGFYKAPADYPQLAPIAEKMNAYRQFQVDAINKFIHDPQQLIHAATADRLAEIEKRAIEAAEEKIETALAKQRADAEMDAYVQGKAKDIYLHDVQGQLRYKPNGEPMLSPKGQAMAEYGGMLEKAGVTDSALMRQLLDKMIQADELSGRFNSPATPASKPATSPPVTKQRFLDRIRSNNRGGTIPDPTAPVGSQQQNPDATMQEITRRIAREQGVSL